MKNKNIVITGGSGILLFPLVIQLAKQGNNVIAIGYEEVCPKIEALNVDNIEYMQCNVLSESAVEELTDKIEEKYKKIDVLINGAGGNHPTASTSCETYNLDNSDISNQDFTKLKLENFKKINDLNFLSVVLVSQKMISLMVEDGGNILNISSMSSAKPMTKVPAYSAAKASVDNFTKWMSVYFAESNIRINSISPGFFLTKQNEKLLMNEDGSLTERSEKIITHTPMRRFGVPEDLVEPIEFLIDDDKAKFITGITLEVDGGFSAYAGV
ncbi:MAG: SDR family oxidoreductase [Coprobacillaceae bacterium]